MALIDEIEPPSRKSAEQTKILNKTTKIKNYFNSVSNVFLAHVSQACKRTSGIIRKLRIDNGLSLYAKNFVLIKRYLPHAIIGLFAAATLIVNIDGKVTALAFYSNFITVNPEDVVNVTDAVDQYTPLIANDSANADKISLASTDGFVNNSGPMNTEVTDRAKTEPSLPASAVPDNSVKTIEYVVENGNTLTELGMKFDVKLATLKYLNNIDNVDTIKPGTKLKIPPKGYEISSSAIAKKAADKKSKLAASQRSTVIRNSSSSRNSQTNPSGYYGTINGVKYVRKAKSNEMQCYTYVTSQGYPVGGHLLAKWIPTNSDSPRVGGLVVTYESWAGHVAVVTGVNGNGTFNLRESNYTHGWITERTMNANSGNIKGFVN